MKIAQCLLVALVVSTSLFAQSQPAPSADTIKSIEKMMDQMVAEGMFRGNLLISQGGKSILTKSYGTSNFEWSQANIASAKFRVGSLTKTMTAILVLDLAQDGKIDLNKTVADYLPYYRKDTGKIITIGQLLDHSSGLPSYTSLPEFNHTISRIKIPVKEFVVKYCQPDLLFPPGTQFFYSNTGFFLLGAIVEAVTGKTYAENLEERVFKPMGMAETGYGQSSSILKHFAYGYMHDGCVNSVAPFTEMSVPFSAGGLHSTVEDLNKMNWGITTNKVLNAKYTDLMLAPHISEGPGAWSAYGWDITSLPTASGKPVQVHAKVGQIFGYSNFMIRTPDFFIVLLGNMTEAESGNIAAAITMILYGVPADKVTPPQPLYTALQHTICTQGLDAGLAYLSKNPPKSSSDVSMLGNNFLGTKPDLNIDITMNDINIALALFNANAKLFPTDPTVYEDLVTGYAKKSAALSASTPSTSSATAPSH